MVACASGALYGLLRAFLTSATESGTSLILQMEFGWPVARIGFVVGSMLVVSALAIMALSVAHHKWNQPNLFMNISSFVALFGTWLLSPRFSSLPFSILLADFLIVASCFCAGSIAEGRAMEHAKPGTVLSVENIWVIRNVGKNNISRFLAPPMARVMLSTSGRMSYFLGLQLFAGSSCVLLLLLTYAHAKTK
mmetsp:Transcript_46064/g.82928  ORF Transcript_46064/g.82928 Transcript_46064/m.82928 type:complete len:193 (-) Transcript_46064:135-713(-)